MRHWKNIRSEVLDEGPLAVIDGGGSADLSVPSGSGSYTEVPEVPSVSGSYTGIAIPVITYIDPAIQPSEIPAIVNPASDIPVVSGSYIEVPVVSGSSTGKAIPVITYIDPAVSGVAGSGGSSPVAATEEYNASPIYMAGSVGLLGILLLLIKT